MVYGLDQYIFFLAEYRKYFCENGHGFLDISYMSYDSIILFSIIEISLESRCMSYTMSLYKIRNF